MLSGLISAEAAWRDCPAHPIPLPSLARAFACLLPGVWLGMSPEGIDFISRCLTRPEDERISVEEALEHPWMQMHVGEVQRAMAFLN